MPEFRSLHPLFAAEARGFDLRQPCSPALVGEIVRALNMYAVLVFHDQFIDDDAQIAFSKLFGPLDPSRDADRPGHKLRLNRFMADPSNLDENNRVMGPDNHRRMSGLANRLWHTDASFKRMPASYSLLHARAVPPEGGETEFADMRAAYDALSDSRKVRLDQLVAEHSIFNSRAVVGFSDFTPEERAALPPVPQPLVRTHPGSGRKALYLASHAGRIFGMPEPEGRMLLLDLIEHATQRDFVYIHEWREGDLVMWDNRCTMHRGREFDLTKIRDVRRTTVQDISYVPPMVPQKAAHA